MQYILVTLLLCVLSILCTSAAQDTTEPCLEVSKAVSAQVSANPHAKSVGFNATIAYQCLRSVPLVKQDALDLLDGWAAFQEWQSTLAYLKTPPAGYLNPGIDLIFGVATLRQRVQSEDITTEFALQSSLRQLLLQAREGHLSFVTDFNRVFTWSRSTGPLVSISSNGQALPETYVLSDIELRREDPSFTPSPVTMINFENTTDFLVANLDCRAQDPDAQYNCMFHQAAGMDLRGGIFESPLDYPGPITLLTFTNGSTQMYPNNANTSFSFEKVTDAASFYHTFCNATRKMQERDGSSKTNSRRVPEPELLQTRQNSLFSPVVQSADKSLTGYIIGGSDEFPLTAVISLTKVGDAIKEIQTKLAKFLEACRKQNVKHLVLDLSTNGGGAAWTAIEVEKQLFPEIYPVNYKTWRAQPQLDVLGTYYTNLSLSALAESNGNQTQSLRAVGAGGNFDATQVLDRHGQRYSDWRSLYGPNADHNDKFSKIWTFDVSSEAIITEQDSGTGVLDLTGYGANVPAPPTTFKPENIIMVSNGYCASACTAISHFLKWQAKVKSVVIGGRPQTGPMQHPGGTKGWLLTSIQSILEAGVQALQSGDISPELLTAAKKTQLATLAKRGEYLIFRSADPTSEEMITVNSVNGIAENDLDTQTPIQFLYEAADCRMFFTEEMMLDPAVTWVRVAEQAFGFNNTKIFSGCVEGSTGHPSSLSGNKASFGDGTPTNVTGMDPPNVGSQNLDLAQLGLKSTQSGGAACNRAGSLLALLFAATISILWI